MKKRLHRALSAALALLLLISVAPVALAADTQYVAGPWVNPKATLSTNNFNDLNTLYTKILASAGAIKSSPKQKAFAKDQPAEVQVMASTTEIGLTDNGTMTILRPTRLILGRYQSQPVSHTLTSPITLKTDMMIASHAGQEGVYSTLVFQQPITIEDGATLLLNGSDNPSMYRDDLVIRDIFVNGTEGSAIIVKEGGTLRLGSVDLKSGENNTSPFVSVQGGTVILQEWASPSSSSATFTNGIPDESDGSAVDGFTHVPAEIETNTPLVEAKDGANVVIKGGTIDLSGNESLVLFEGENNTLTLSGGTITSADGPAIVIPENVTLVIPADSTATVTTNNADAQAIDLAGGATVEKSGIVTVIVSDANAAAGDNYVDNNGVIHLAAGAKAGTDDDSASENKPMNAAVVLPDGTIIQGNGSTAPTVTTKKDEATGETVITVDVPAGGSVQEPGKEPVNMPFGGTVDDGVVNADKPSVIPPIAGTIINGLGSMVASPFVDVTTMDYYYDAVNWAVESGVTTGTGRYTFSPDEPCTRAQAVTFLWRAAGSPAPKNAVTAFVDVDSTAYYAKAVAWAVENGVTNGTSDTTFSPSAPCTRAQIVSFLYRAFGSTTNAAVPFNDVALDAYYAPAVAWAAANNVTGGTTTSTFSPAATCTRAQIVTFLYRCR